MSHLQVTLGKDQDLTLKLLNLLIHKLLETKLLQNKIMIIWKLHQLLVPHILEEKMRPL